MANTHNKTPTKKSKLVRDSFTIPKAEFVAIEDMKMRAIALGTSVKKSELLRAGLKLLQSLNDSDYKAALAAVPTLKTGRPTSEEPKAEVPKPARKTVVRKAVTAKTAVKAVPKVSAKQVAQAVEKSTAKPPAKRSAAIQTSVTKAPAQTVKPTASAKQAIKRTPAPKVAMPVEAVQPATPVPAA